MKRQLATLVVALAGGAAIAAGAPAAADTGAAVSETALHEAKAAKWSKSESWGSTAGTITPTTAKGWVKDKESNRYCVRLKIGWVKDGKVRDVDTSKKACGKGKTAPVRMRAGDDNHFKADKAKFRLEEASP